MGDQMENTDTSNSEMSPVNLQNLPTDVLLLIFKYCDYRALIRLSILCKRFNYVMKDEFIWHHRSLNTLITNQRSDEMKKRFSHNISAREKVRLWYNWKTARYKEYVTFSFDNRYLPWLCLGNDHLWLSKGNIILAFKRNYKHGLVKINCHSSVSLVGHTEDVCRFVYRDGILVSGGRDKSIYGFSADKTYRTKILFHTNTAHNSDVTAVDMYDRTVVSGSYDGTIKLWQVIERQGADEMEMVLESTINVGESVDSLSFRPQADECIVGSAGFNKPPLHLYNIQRGAEVLKFNLDFKFGAGVLDVHWETPQMVLTTGYDTYIRLWDCRTGDNVQSWGDPFDSSIYCLASDNLYTILAGTCNHGRIQLWDKRQKCSVQMYFLSTSPSINRKSSIYSLTFDPYNMYAALDRTLNTVSFAGHSNKSKNQVQTMWRRSLSLPTPI